VVREATTLVVTALTREEVAMAIPTNNALTLKAERRGKKCFMSEGVNIERDGRDN
jgi:hypothetical protein